MMCLYTIKGDNSHLQVFVSLVPWIAFHGSNLFFLRVQVLAFKYILTMEKELTYNVNGYYCLCC